MSFGAAGKPDYAEAFGRITGEESRAIGVHWNFFPDADVNSNPANPIINTRSFGEDPQQVGDLVAAYVRGARASGMLTTVKHFPGHGDTATDSHLSVAQVTGDRARLNSVELAPFRKAIEAGVDSVMVAHVTVPALEPDPNRVATTSPAIVTDLLKHQLGFQGIVVTDALDMAGLTRLYSANIGRAAVDAFKAGSDLLLIPADLDASYNAVLEAARQRRDSSRSARCICSQVVESKSFARSPQSPPGGCERPAAKSLASPRTWLSASRFPTTPSRWSGTTASCCRSNKRELLRAAFRIREWKRCTTAWWWSCFPTMSAPRRAAPWSVQSKRACPMPM